MKKRITKQLTLIDLFLWQLKQDVLKWSVGGEWSKIRSNSNDLYNQVKETLNHEAEKTIK